MHAQQKRWRRFVAARREAERQWAEMKTQRWCPHCSDWREFRQQEVDEVCCEVCVGCGKVIDPDWIPF